MESVTSHAQINPARITGRAGTGGRRKATREGTETGVISMSHRAHHDITSFPIICCMTRAQLSRWRA
eukprot:1031106-Pyramimonas_sp.AAC.1